jgi:hypothetical protein
MRYLNMTKEMIFKRLMAGEDATMIGNELVAMLNEAVKEKEAADEAKRKEEEAMAWQMKDAEVLADVMNDYFKKYCGATEDMVNAEGLVAAASDLAKMLKVVDKIGNSVNEIKATAPKLTIKEKKQGEPEKVTVKTGKEAENWIEDAFADFFKAWGI